MRLRSLIQSHGDLLLALAVVALGLVQTLADDGLSESEKLYGVTAICILGALLAVRRRYPLLPLIAVCLGPLLEPLAGEAGDGEVFGLVLVIAVYTAAAHTDGARMWVGGALAFALAWGALITDPEGVYLGGMLFFGMFVGIPWVAGRAVRHRRLREQQLEREKAEAEAAIVEERSRIARELHDVVAHAISVIVLQARGGRKVLETEPDEARQALDAIEHTATQALDEMRRLLGLLRESDEELALTPQPTLTRVDELVARVREAGLPVELAVVGEPTTLPPGVDLSAYRIVQEALTNALKHAGPATARVTVRYGDGELDLEITDDGAGDTNGDGGGHGLVGIRERVAVFGGDVEAGRRPEGGYVVRARLPYASER
ncbi:MAG TPA: histidine kinase [Gaiellaceae bacterium]|nr:histidine kinase [Gaiellaceae bacterium]